MVDVKQIEEDNYGRQVLLITLVLFVILMGLFYKIQQKGPQDPIANNAFVPIVKNMKVYMLKSKSTAMINHKNKGSDYALRLDRFKSIISDLGYSVEYINEDKIPTLLADDLLVVTDAVALKDTSKENIKHFLNAGGNLFFNFTAGFSGVDGKLLGDSFVNEITQLKLSEGKNYLHFKKGLNITQRLLSAIDNDSKGVLLNVVINDNLPIFTSQNNKKADIYMTNYSQINPPIFKEDKSKSLTPKEAGCGWHGYYGKGKWFYTSFPSYVFYEARQSEYKDVLGGVLNYLTNNAVVSKYPFVDSEKIVFISEDTEYKFKNFQKFSDLTEKYKISATAFIVSSLAENQAHKEMMDNISKNEYVEFASHSHMHKKIINTNNEYVKQETADTKPKLEKFSSQSVLGFRPPREELDDVMKMYLSNAGFSYVLGSAQEYLYPKFDKKLKDLLLIPRRGTDDYSYLINLDWGRDQIVEQIIKETNFVTDMDSVFTLSMHTHLFAYKTNIKIVEDYFKYLKAHPEFTTMNGRTIAKKVKQSNDINLAYTNKDNVLIVDIANNNNEDVKNFHCKIFKNPNKVIKSIKSSASSVKKDTSNKSEVKIIVDSLKANSITTIYIEL